MIYGFKIIFLQIYAMSPLKSMPGLHPFLVIQKVSAACVEASKFYITILMSYI